MYIVSFPEGITAMDSKITIMLLGGILTDSITGGQHKGFSIFKTEVGSQMA